MVKLVEYPDSSDDERGAQDVHDAYDQQDARSDSSHWSSFGQIPSDPEDSFSFPMRSPESEHDDSDEDYAPSESGGSSVATEDLEFPAEMEQEEREEQEEQEHAHMAETSPTTRLEESSQETEQDKTIFYKWEDLRAAFDDNPFKRRSMGPREMETATAEAEEGKQETTDGLKRENSFTMGRKILHPRKPNKPTGVTPKFADLSTSNQDEEGGGVLKGENKFFPTPEETKTSVFTFSVSQTGGAEEFSIGTKQSKSDDFDGSAAGFSFGKPSPKMFAKGSEDAHMMSPPPPVATTAASSSSDFTFGHSEQSPKPSEFTTTTGYNHFNFSPTNSATPGTNAQKDDDAHMRSPSPKPKPRTPNYARTNGSSAPAPDYKNRKPFHFVELGGKDSQFGSAPGIFNRPPTETTTPTTIFGTKDAGKPTAFFSTGVPSPTQRYRNGRRRKLNGSSSPFSSASTTSSFANGAQPATSSFANAGVPHESKAPFNPTPGSSGQPVDQTIPNAGATCTGAAPPPAPSAANSTGGHFLFRKANGNQSRPPPLQTVFGAASRSAPSRTPDTTTAAPFPFGANSNGSPGQTSATSDPAGTSCGFRIGTTGTKKATARTSFGRNRRSGIFANKNSPKRPTKSTVATEPEPTPAPGVFSGPVPTSASPFSGSSTRTSKKTHLRKRMGRSPPADPFVVPTYQPHPSEPNVGRPATKCAFGAANIDDKQAAFTSIHATATQSNQQSSRLHANTNSASDRERAAFPSRSPKESDPNSGRRRILRAALRQVRDSGAASAPAATTNHKGSSRSDAEMTSEDDESGWGELKRLGGVAYSSRRYSDAAEYYRQSIEALESILECNVAIATRELTADKAKLHANRAACLMMLTQIPEAQRECRQSIDVDPTYARAYLRLGRIQILLGDTANAQANLDTAKHLMAGDMGAQGISNDQADQAQLRKMEASIKKLVTLQGEIKWYTDCGDYKQALVHTEHALTLAPSSRKLQVDKARVLLLQKEYDQVVEFCTIVVHKQQAIHDQQGEGWQTHSSKEKLVGDIKFVGIDLGLLWATALHYRNDVEDAVRILEALEIVAPCSSHVVQLKVRWQNMKALKHNGNDRFKRGEYQEALRFYSEAVQIDPQHEEYCAIIYCNRAAAQMALERFHTAILDCNEALQRKPKYPRALLRRARCHVALDMHHEAVKDFDQYLREHPGDSSSDSTADVRRERNEAKAAIAKAREEARQREAAKKRAEREQRQRRQQRWENPWDEGKFYDNFRYNTTSSSSSGSRFKSSGPNSRQSFMAPKTQRRTHYDVLGIEKTSTVDQIKKAYRKLALVYHPDKAKTSTHADLFKDMTAAYNVLSDESARAKYDRELIYNRFGNYYES